MNTQDTMKQTRSHPGDRPQLLNVERDVLSANILTVLRERQLKREDTSLAMLTKKVKELFDTQRNQGIYRHSSLYVNTVLAPYIPHAVEEMAQEPLGVQFAHPLTDARKLWLRF